MGDALSDTRGISYSRDVSWGGVFALRFALPNQSSKGAWASMRAEDYGPTLEGLAQRLEALERENERMRSEMAQLRTKVAPLKGSGTRRDEEPAAEWAGETGDKKSWGGRKPPAPMSPGGQKKAPLTWKPCRRAR